MKTTSAVTKYEVECCVEIYSDDNARRFIGITEEQYDLINKIWLETDAKCIKIGDRTIAVSAIKEVSKNTTSHPAPTMIVMTDEQRAKNLKSLEELRQQLKVKNII
jgi:aspartate 1-decarboxylase